MADRQDVAGIEKTFTYDADNRLKQVGSVSFVYGPDGKRLKKVSARARRCISAMISS